MRWVGGGLEWRVLRILFFAIWAVRPNHCSSLYTFLINKFVVKC